MDHIVRFTTSSGEDKIEDVDSLDAAVARVEALRNEGVDNPRLYRPVKVEFTTYVKASVVDDAAGGPAPAPAAADPDPAPAPSDSPEAPPAAKAAEPPPGAMPLSPQRPTAKVSDAVEGGEAEAPEGEEGPRRTLFSRG